MRSRTSCFMAFVLIIGAAGCGDDPTGATGDPLTSQESRSLAYAILFASFGFLGELPVEESSAHVAAGLAADAVDFTFAETSPCPLGGTIELSGRVVGSSEPENGTWSLDYTGTMDYARCGVEGTMNNFVLDGDPDVDVAISLRYVEFMPSGTQTLSYDGGIAWETEGKSGTCTLDLTMSWTADGQTSTVDGSICGQDVQG